MIANSGLDTKTQDTQVTKLLQRVAQAWQRWGIYLLALLFTAVTFTFLVNKHNAFNTRTYDFARFDQAIWGVLNGRLLFSSIDYRSILGNHFSPYMALLAPLFWLWPDERMLFLVQAASVAVGGLMLALMLRRRYAALAPWFLLAIYLNPALHAMVLFEFRRVVLAFPYLALALYALDIKKYWLLLIALFVALLCKEDIGLFVFGVGLFLLIVRREWRWGIALLILGFVWAVGVSLWVIPAFREPGTEYPQLFYFSYLGNSYSEIGATLQADPLIILRQLFDVSRLQAIGRFLLPLGIFLPFLAVEWLLIVLPTLGLLLLSGDVEMFTLQKWYTAPLLPVFFAAVAIGLGHLDKRWARWATVWLLLAVLLGYYLLGSLPGGRRYSIDEFKVTDHDRAGLLMVSAVPDTVSVATQPHYVPHLAHREQIFHYPWIKIGQENIDYFLLDRQSDPYPFSKDDMNGEITKFLADPTLELVAELDEIYLFRQGDDIERGAFGETAVVGETIQLNGFDVALPDENGLLRSQTTAPLQAQAGRPLRVDLYWEALAAPDAELTVSVRLAAPDGFIHTQHDGIPGLGSKPTSWWQSGWLIRDVHTLTLPPDLSPGSYSLELVIYDSFTQTVIPFADGADKLTLASVEIQP